MSEDKEIDPDFLAIVGKELGRAEAVEPINEAMIHQWCEAFDNKSPAYWEDAQDTRWGGIIAPPEMLRVWMMRRPEKQYEEGQSQQPEELDIFFKKGYRAAAVSNESFFYRPVRPGERLRAVTRAVDVTPEKTTKIGYGHFYTREVTFSDQADEVVGKELITVFRYKPLSDREGQG